MAANIERQRAVGLLLAVAANSRRPQTARTAGHCFGQFPDMTASPPALSELRDQLHLYSLSFLLRNRDLFQIAAREIRLLVDVLQHVLSRGATPIGMQFGT
jgi:hypothetical protein